VAEECWVCGERAPDGGLRMTEVGDMVCRWVIPCARRIAATHGSPRQEIISWVSPGRLTNDL
jgi:hypothetical protein